MNDFKRKGGFRKGGEEGGFRPKFGNDRGGKGGFGGNRDHRGSGRPPELFPAICADCGKNCEVPFRPMPGKAVYCRDCFNKQGYVAGRNSNGSDGPRPDFRRDARPQFKPREEFARPAQADNGVEAMKRQLDIMEAKMNRILSFIERKPEAQAPAAVIAPAAPAKAAKAVKAKKTKKTK